MIVTKDWVMRYRTPEGDWTATQLDALGVTSRKEVETVVGREVSEVQRRAFEAAGIDANAHMPMWWRHVRRP